MKSEDLLKKYLSERHMMQLATVRDGQPWCCTVYFVADEKNNLYWASLASRRHSQEIADDPKVAAAIPVQHVKGGPVVGIQIEGEAKMLNQSEEILPIAKLYADKFSRDEQWVEDISSGQTDHKIYKLSPSSIVLFDEQHFAEDPRIEVLKSD